MYANDLSHSETESYLSKQLQGLNLIQLGYRTWALPDAQLTVREPKERGQDIHETSNYMLTWLHWVKTDMLVVCECVFEFFSFFLLGTVEEDLPRKTVSLVVALVSPTLLEATHSYMASSRGVRKGWILSTEPEPSSNSITCRCERQDNVKGDFFGVRNRCGTSHRPGNE